TSDALYEAPRFTGRQCPGSEADREHTDRRRLLAHAADRRVDRPGGSRMRVGATAEPAALEWAPTGGRTLRRGAGLPHDPLARKTGLRRAAGHVDGRWDRGRRLERPVGQPLVCRAVYVRRLDRK